MSIPTLVSVGNNPASSSGSGINIKNVLIFAALLGGTYLVWKNRDKIKAMFGKKSEEKK